MHRLDRIFNPRSVAVIGSKAVDNHSWLRTVLPFEGPKYHVNVDESEWASAAELGFPSFKSLTDIPDEVDFVIISVPAPIVPRLLRDCVTKGVAGVHLYTAGFSETGTEEGAKLEEEVITIAREGGLNVIGPNCMGIFVPSLGIGVNLGQYHGESGGFGFISHSGSQSSSVARGSAVHGVKVSKLISMGNGVILDSHDYLDYFEQDDETTMVGMYLEGIRDGPAFVDRLRRLSERKPVLVWKVGETEDAARAVDSHSGSQSSSVARGSAVHGVRVSKLISMGNGVILDSHDYLDYFEQDDETTMVGMYLEGVRDGPKFVDRLRRLSERKPVLVWKVGETEDAARAVDSHSGSQSSLPAVWDAMLRQCGAIKVDNADELFETAKLLKGLPPVTGQRLGLLAISGGHATEMTNIFSKAGFSIPSLTEQSYERILEHFNIVGSSYSNPLEGRTLADPVNMNNVLDVLNEDPNVDIIVHEVQVSFRNDRISVYRGHSPDIFCDFRDRAKKPYFVALSNSFPVAPQETTQAVFEQFTEAGIPTVFGLQGAASALRRVVDYYVNREA